MFIKPIVIPAHILQADALDRRTPPHHPFKYKISRRAANLLSGYKGEKSLKYHLDFLPEKEFFIHHYIRLPDKNGHFQMDFLLLSRCFYLIIEVKNVYGNMHFDDISQTYREMDGNVEVFTNPLEQIKLQHQRLLSWLRIHEFPPVPIEKIVVYSRDDTYLRNLTSNQVVSEIVMHRDSVLPKIKGFMNKHQFSLITEDQLMKLSWMLLNDHVPEESSGMGNFYYSDWIKGVYCPGCGAVPMKWKSGKWQCVNCSCASKTTHRPALADYALLVGKYINNRQARDWLQLDSIHTTKRLIQKEYFQEFGKTSGRRYKLDIEKLLNDKVHNEFAKVHN